MYDRRTRSFVAQVFAIFLIGRLKNSFKTQLIFMENISARTLFAYYLTSAKTLRFEVLGQIS